MPVEFTCKQCGKVTLVPPHDAGRSYCSKLCNQLYLQDHPPQGRLGRPNPKVRGPNNYNWKGGKNVQYTCQYCGKAWWHYPSQVHKYCSQECFQLDRARKVAERDGGTTSITKAVFQKTCCQCGKSFTTSASHKNHRLCSLACRNAANYKDRGFNTCVNCGKVFRKPSPPAPGRFCSVACHNAYQRGEHAPNWKGGKSYWRDPDWPQTRKAILERDAYTCQCCGKQAGNRLHVHHIVPWLETFDNSPENLLTDAYL